MTPEDIKEKVLKEMDIKNCQSHGWDNDLVDLACDKTIDLTLAEVGRVIDEIKGNDIYYDKINEVIEYDEDEDGDLISKEELKQKLGIK